MKLNIIRLLLIIHLTKADEDEAVCCQDLFLTINDIIAAPIGIVGPWSSTTRNTTMNVSDDFHSMVGDHSLKRIEGNRWRLDPSIRSCMTTTTTTTTSTTTNVTTDKSEDTTIAATNTEDTTTTAASTTTAYWCDENTEYPIWWAEGTIDETCNSKNTTTKFITRYFFILSMYLTNQSIFLYFCSDWKVAFNWTQNGKNTRSIELKIECLKGEQKIIGNV